MNKKWLWGCGGCLVAVLLVLVAVFGLGWWGFNTVTSGSNTIANNIFGNKLPANYSSLFGMPIDSDEGSTQFVLMMDAVKGRMLVALDTPFEAEDMTLVRAGDTKKLQSLIEKAIKESSKKSRANDIHLVAQQKIPDLPKEAYLFSFIMDGDKGYMPILAGVIPVGADRAKLLLLMDPQKGSDDDNAQFTEEFADMNQHLIDILQTTAVLSADSEYKKEAKK